jgi:hypothetical protein
MKKANEIREETNESNSEPNFDGAFENDDDSK